MNITIFGGGAWGRALAFAFGQKSKVYIVSRRNISTLLDPINQKLLVPIEQIPISDSIPKADYFVIAITTSALREWFANIKLPQDTKAIIASKGIEEGSGAFVSDIAGNFLPEKNLCFLAGPSFAKEVNLGLPCALTILSKNLVLAEEFAELMPNFIKPYVKSDVIGGEIAGAYKNVIAIAAGICDGLKLGQNAKASLLSRGLVEMCRFGEYFGGKTQTFLGLSGAGDLFLSANSVLSRNYRVGLGLAKNQAISDILAEIGEVAEGIKTSLAITQISRKEDIYTPIADEVQAIIKGKEPAQSMRTLMKR